MILSDSIMSLLNSMLGKPEKQQQRDGKMSPSSKAAKQKQKQQVGLGQLTSLKFLYKNPIGRRLTSENLHKKKYANIWRAADEEKCDAVVCNADNASQREYIRSIPNAIRYRGLLLQGYLVYGKVLRAIENFDIRSDDVWLVTYPKSGTTWMEEILSLIRSNGDVAMNADKPIFDRVPHLEVGKPFGHIKWLREIESPRLLATHLPYDYIPVQLRANKAKIIYVIRNPKDNAVSYYHHHRMSTFLGNYSGTWSNFLSLFREGHLVYGDWFEHVSGYWRLACEHPDRVLFVSYEELKVNLPKMIETIAEFIGRPDLTAEQIDTIARHCSFDKMRCNKMVNREALPIGDLFDMTQSKFMRKGIIGDWRNHFSAEESAEFDRAYEDRLRAIGLDMVYDHETACDIVRREPDGRILHLPKCDDNMTMNMKTTTTTTTTLPNERSS